MAPPPDPTPVARYLQAAVGPDAYGPADAALLARFAADRDEGAFELLVWRHAGAVVRSCRAVLRDHHAWPRTPPRPCSSPSPVRLWIRWQQI